MNEAEPRISPDSMRDIEVIERDAWVDMHHATPKPMQEALGLECVTIDDGVALLCRKIDHIQFNRIAGLGVTQPVRAEALDQGIAAFDSAALKNWIIHVVPDAEDLEALCVARGLTPHPRTWAKFIREAEPPPAVTTDLSIREIGPAESEAFGATATAGFGMPPFLAGRLAGLPGRPKWRCFMAYDGAAPVAAGAIYVDGAVGWLGIGATLPTHRGRGAQSALLAIRINAGIAAGCTTFTTETGIPHPGEAGPSFGNIKKAGFRVAYERPNWRRET